MMDSSDAQISTYNLQIDSYQSQTGIILPSFLRILAEMTARLDPLLDVGFSALCVQEIAAASQKEHRKIWAIYVAVLI